MKEQIGNFILDKMRTWPREKFYRVFIKIPAFCLWIVFIGMWLAVGCLWVRYSRTKAEAAAIQAAYEQQETRADRYSRYQAEFERQRLQRQYYQTSNAAEDKAE